MSFCLNRITANADADGRGVVVTLTDAGIARLTETAPVHLRGVSNCSSRTAPRSGARRRQERSGQSHRRRHVLA